MEKEEKLVAARNEENAKVSAAALKDDTSSSTPVIETIPVTKPTTLTLRHTYKEGKSENVCVRLEACTGQVVTARQISFWGGGAVQKSWGCLISEALQHFPVTCKGHVISFQVGSNKAYCSIGSFTLVLWKPFVFVSVQTY